MQHIFAMCLARRIEVTGDGPGAAPSDVDTYLYSGSKIGISWTNGDTKAQTEVSIDGGSTVHDIVAPRVDTYDTGLTSGVVPAVRHVLNGQYTAWVGQV